MPESSRAIVQSAVMDSTRWDRFTHRPGDIFVCTPPKCGTTWTQTIVASLLWPAGDVPGPVMNLAPIHTVERALEVGSLERLIPADRIRPYLIGLVEQRDAR